MNKDLEPAEASPNGNRWCTNCDQGKPSAGGYWKLNENKKSRRWLCKTCAEKKINGKN